MDESVLLQGKREYDLRANAVREAAGRNIIEKCTMRSTRCAAREAVPGERSPESGLGGGGGGGGSEYLGFITLNALGYVKCS